MKNLKNWILLGVLIFTSMSALSQNQITGTVVDGDFNAPLPGASVVVKNTSNGTSTDLDGNFELSTAEKSGQLIVSFIGYKTLTVSYTVTADHKLNLGKIVLKSDDNLLGDIVIVGVADVAKDRKTPVAVSTIKAAEIQERLGSQEFPELLNTTPSVYATKAGGGFGDSRINIRGFDQKNIAVMVNGMPINDMEGGSVYWSNWSGLSDVTTAMQVQRGLGSSKLAISSVGGTINILTRTSDAREGGSLSMGVGNNNFFKGTASYSTGTLENGLSASVLVSNTFGDGYVDGTKFDGTNYFVGLGYKTKDDRHNFQFTFTGATQWHNQRSYANPISEYLKYGENGEPNVKYNSDWGYRDGKEFSWKKNYYHKPVASLNWDFKISEAMKLSSVFYGSWGRGGGTGVLGNLNGKRDFDETFKDANGRIRFDDIVTWNQGGQVSDFGANRKQTNGQNLNGDRDGFTRRSSVNSHDWYGTVINLNTKLADKWTLDFGVDARTYKGYHFQILSDLMGADGYIDAKNSNFQSLNDKGKWVNDKRYIYETYSTAPVFNPFEKMNDREKIGYHNDGNVNWYGGFTQLEYAGENLTAFVQGALSNQAFQRVDYFSYNQAMPIEGEPNYKTDWKNMLGGNVKGGANLNLDEYNNVFINAGYYSRQPFMNGGVYLNNKNDINPNLKNETIVGLEVGYGLRTEKFNANVNLYRTTWKDRVMRKSENFDDLTAPDPKKAPKIRGYANLYGVEQVHMGAELDFLYRPADFISFNGTFSYGDWRYNSNVTATYFDDVHNTPIVDENNNIRKETLYLKNAKVGDAPQMTANLGVAIQPVSGLKFDANYRYSDKYYSYIDAIAFKDPENKGSIELPSFGLLDAGVSYKMEVGRDKQNSFTMRLNVNNVLDKIYIADGKSNIHVLTKEEYAVKDAENTVLTGLQETYGEYNNYLAKGTYKGLDTRNQVYFGNGRTWNLTFRYQF